MAAGGLANATATGLRRAGNSSGRQDGYSAPGLSMAAWPEASPTPWIQAVGTPKPSAWPESPAISLATETPEHKTMRAQADASQRDAASSEHADFKCNSIEKDAGRNVSAQRRRKKSCCGCRSRKSMTALQEYAASFPLLRGNENLPVPLYPMYVLPVERFFELKAALPHQDLKREGALLTREESHGPTIFVSHQWCSEDHPDPDFKQLPILQEALRNLREGRVRLQADLLNQTCFNVSAKLSAAERQELLGADIWYDFFSIPQRYAAAEASTADIEGAMLSIPSYAQMADYFIILAPPVRHESPKTRSANTAATLSYETWRRRGWCRLERAAWALAAGGTRMLLVTSADQISIVGTQEVLFAPPGVGDFTFEADRQRIASVMELLVEHCLEEYLRQGQLEKYRMLLSLRSSLLSGFSSGMRDVGIRCFRSWMDSQGKARSEDRALQFLLDYGFQSVNTCDSSGRSPLHYAAVAGDCMAIRRLVLLRGDLHSRTKTADALHFVRPGSTPLHLAALFNRQWQVAKLLLEQDASADDKLSFDSGRFEGTALYQSCISDNFPIAGMLMERRASPECRDVEGSTPLLLAALFGNIGLARCLLSSHADASAVDNLGKSALHMLAIFSGCSELVRDFLAARCPIDGRHHDISSSFVLASSRLAHRLGSQNLLLKMMHQLPGMTPLMCAAFLGNREVSLELLRWKADPEARNHREMTAADLAAFAGLPEYFVLDLLPDGEEREQRENAHKKETHAKKSTSALPRRRRKHRPRRHTVGFRPSLPAHVQELIAAEKTEKAAAEAAAKADAAAKARAAGDMMEIIWAHFDGAQRGEDYLTLKPGLGVRYLNREEDGWLWGELVDPMKPKIALGPPGWYPPGHTAPTEVYRPLSA